ncbi:hypothetical protein EXIGLDRAFT_811339 [Exidia glandulosa HHB12029]|uniref:BSD domain-containing protein n=1 Tax=Exidia glandulosa HHB12029 TaxID=1314781 RepID=A0A165LEA0_EXIGL|nr:hypothetical protein EXIGLDRAFT_811339 [Exidia glandulosa HHB12029]
MPAQDALLRAPASYQKKPGKLELTATHLQWTPDSASAPSVRIRAVDMATLFCSKPGAPAVRLKLNVFHAPSDGGHFFTFTSPRADEERENFKRELSTIIARNRASTTPAPSPSPTKPRSVVGAAAPGTPTPAPPDSLSQADFALRKTVILKHPELAQLHRALVISGQISEAEFWEGREHLLLAEARAAGQKRGKAGPLLELRPSAGDDGVIKITPQRIADIFDAFPVVARAHMENVPHKLSEEQFWKRYFSSRLFNAHRASIRTAAAQHVVKDDAIFDAYLEPEDDQLEPRRPHAGGIDVFLDLGATREDHGETGNDPDVTMQPGKQRAVLPLIRRFNEHSERLLTSALGDLPPAKRRRVDTGDAPDDPYSEIDIADLHDESTALGIALEMKDQQRYFEARSSNNKGDAAATVDLAAIIRQTRVELGDWSTHLSQMRLDKHAAEEALKGMTESVSARMGNKSRKNDIPDAVLRDMTTAHNATNEFLRQFWGAIYPQAAEGGQVLAPLTTPAQKKEKAGKMAAYLGNTHDKVDALAQQADAAGGDSGKVRVALQPMLDAVDRALDYFYNHFNQPVAAKKSLVR